MQGLFGLPFHIIVHHWRKLGQGLRTDQEPGGRSWFRGQERVLLSGLLLMAWSPCFLIQPRTSSPGVAPPTMGWALLHQSPTEKMTYWFAYSPVLGKSFLSWSSFPSDDSSVCQVDIKLLGTIPILSWGIKLQFHPWELNIVLSLLTPTLSLASVSPGSPRCPRIYFID